MCCLFTTLVLLGPRAAILVWGLAAPARWEATFNTFVWPLVGFLFPPWTTMMYVAVFPLGLSGLDWFWLIGALFIDILSYSGSLYGNRDRMNSYRTSGTA